MNAPMYLDCDTTPPLASKQLRTTVLRTAKRRAIWMLGAVTEGQIGIYASPMGDGFAGYAIKYPGETPYFEAAGAAS